MGWFSKKFAGGDRELDELVSLLRDDGWRIEHATEKVIRLKIDGGFYLLLREQGDQGFFNLSFPGVYSKKNAGSDLKVLQAMQYTNQNCKFIKCFSIEDSVHLSIQAMASSPKELALHFERYISALKFGSRTFWEEVTRK